MGYQLFNRRVRVTVDSLQTTDLRCVFKVKKTSTPEPNTLDLEIYNLSAATRAQMQTKGSKVLVEAGYQTNLGSVFSGVARTTDHLRKGADWVTKIQCGDGEQLFQFAQTSKSYAPGTPLSKIILDQVQALGLNPGNVVQALKAGGPSAALQQFTKGFVAHGRAAPSLDTLLKSQGLEWSIQDGALQVLQVGKPNPGVAEVISADTGMLDSPEHGTPETVGKPAYLKVKCLLRPQIRPGSSFQLQSVATKNLPVNYQAVNVEHEGDTDGGPWETRIESVMLGAQSS